MTDKTMSQNIQDILDILNSLILPTLNKHDNSFQELNERQSRMEKKLDSIAKYVTINLKNHDDRLHATESKLNIYYE